MMFRVTKFGFEGFAFTVTILTFFVTDVRRSRTLANSALRMRTFRFAPFVRESFSRRGPMHAYGCSRAISRLRFLRNCRYRPPVGLRFDPACERAIGVAPTERR